MKKYILWPLAILGSALVVLTLLSFTLVILKTEPPYDLIITILEISMSPSLLLLGNAGVLAGERYGLEFFMLPIFTIAHTFILWTAALLFAGWKMLRQRKFIFNWKKVVFYAGLLVCFAHLSSAMHVYIDTLLKLPQP
jgi:hypothetical protein